MNYIKHLTGFFDRIVRDEKLNPTHISLYISLFQYWNVNRFQNPISISRSEIMRISKISAKATYHKCMRELHDFGYIRYEPSYNPFRGSLVHLMNFDDEKTSEESQPKKRTGSGQVLNQQQAGAEQALVPYINNTNITNSLNNREPGSNVKIKLLQRSDGRKKEKSCAKKEREIPDGDMSSAGGGVMKQHGGGGQLPQLSAVEEFFKQQSHPPTEAKKYFNHYKAIGWKLSGNPIEDWKALAEKWMINATSFSKNNKTNNSSQLHTAKEKKYEEPL